jgi:hypothetical protein
MSAAIKRIDDSEQPFAGVSLTAAQAERLLSICVTMIDLCAEVTGKIDPAVGTMVAYACEDALNGILGTKSQPALSAFGHDRKRHA